MNYTLCPSQPLFTRVLSRTSLVITASSFCPGPFSPSFLGATHHSKSLPAPPSPSLPLRATPPVEV